MCWLVAFQRCTNYENCIEAIAENNTLRMRGIDQCNSFHSFHFICVTYYTQIFPDNSPPSLISLLLNFQHPIHTTLTFSFQSLKQIAFFLWTVLQKLSLSTPAHSFFYFLFLSFHFFLLYHYFTFLFYYFFHHLLSPNSYFTFTSPEFLYPLQFTMLMVWITSPRCLLRQNSTYLEQFGTLCIQFGSIFCK